MIEMLSEIITHLDRGFDAIRIQLDELDSSLHRHIDHTNWVVLQTEISRAESELVTHFTRYQDWIRELALDKNTPPPIESLPNREWSAQAQTQAVNALNYFVQHAQDHRFGRLP